MGCRILEGKDRYAVFYCSTSDWAFGPLMADVEEAERFVEFLKVDPRMFTDNELESKYCDFRVHEIKEGKCQHEGESKNGICLECGEESL